MRCAAAPGIHRPSSRPGRLPSHARGRRLRDGGARRLAFALAAVLAGCAPLPSAPPKPPIGPEIVVRISETGRPARELVERVAAGCWLDGIVRGASMIVDRQTGRVIIVSDTDDLLAADFLEPQGGRSRLRLSGPVIADPVKAQRLVETLDLAVRTGVTSCPIAAG
jgi:hypothetical protein